MFGGESFDDIESRAGRAAKRAKAAMKIHQVNKDFVTIREVGQQQVFAIEEALAVISSKVGLPAAMPVEVVAALSNFATRLDDMDERQKVIDNNMNERIDTMVEQIKSMKNQLTSVMARQNNAVAADGDDPILAVVGPDGQTPPDAIFPKTYGKLLKLDDKTSKDLLLFYEMPTDPEEVNNTLLRKFLGAR